MRPWKTFACRSGEGRRCRDGSISAMGRSAFRSRGRTRSTPEACRRRHSRGVYAVSSGSWLMKIGMMNDDLIGVCYAKIMIDDRCMLC